MALTNKLSAIGEAIREKTGNTELLTLDEMPEAIRSIETGGGTSEVTDLAIQLISDRESITSIVVPDGVTKIDSRAFDTCIYLQSITIPNSVTSIKDSAFRLCDLKTIELPESITEIGEYAFYANFDLVLTKLPENLISLGAHAFNGTNLLITELPKGITEIPISAFDNCAISNITIHDGINSLGSYSFDSCKNLIEVTFEGTPTIIKETAFRYCSNLTTINVPWAEGAVSGAPWGATNATINYGYTGEV